MNEVLQKKAHNSQLEHVLQLEMEYHEVKKELRQRVEDEYEGDIQHLKELNTVLTEENN
jgi:hypothetical protein